MGITEIADCKKCGGNAYSIWHMPDVNKPLLFRYRCVRCYNCAEPSTTDKGALDNWNMENESSGDFLPDTVKK